MDIENIVQSLGIKWLMDVNYGVFFNLLDSPWICNELS